MLYPQSVHSRRSTTLSPKLLAIMDPCPPVHRHSFKASKTSCRHSAASAISLSCSRPQSAKTFPNECRQAVGSTTNKFLPLPWFPQALPPALAPGGPLPHTPVAAGAVGAAVPQALGGLLLAPHALVLLLATTSAPDLPPVRRAKTWARLCKSAARSSDGPDGSCPGGATRAFRFRCCSCSAAAWSRSSLKPSSCHSDWMITLRKQL
mmetsp:Transcript_33013/g.66217  ORF Transcript_33013/g.66217 Transcript_33013/m.66217 type:complete len:207 (-) Transcript_33013:107-727(-)